MKQNLGPFILTQKQKQLLIRLILMKYLNHYSTNISNIQKPLGIGSGWISCRLHHWCFKVQPRSW